MVKRSKSEHNLTPNKSKQRKSAKMNSLVKSLENSLQQYQQDVKKSAKCEDDTNKHNKQMLNVLQQANSNGNLTRSQVDVSASLSTMSMVHLQYKYEELLSSHEGLLKLLETKVKEVRKCYSENDKLIKDIRTLKYNLEEQQRTIKLICDKYTTMKERKQGKIKRIRFERDAFKLAHDKLVHLLHIKCMEEDDYLIETLASTSDCFKALLINEIRRCKHLEYENYLLRQHVPINTSK